MELALYSRDAGVAVGRARAVCFPRSGEAVAAAVRVARRHGRPFVARGSGTGLAGGATPLDDPVVIVTTQMNRVLDVDEAARVAWVEPGVLNLDLTRTVSPLGLHYSPDPSSQQACTIGGNVGTNAGGPHCLADGVTSAHVLAVDVVLADGTQARLGGLAPDTPGYDLRGCFVGSEGTMGIATRIAVRLMPDAPRVATLLCAFDSVEAAAATVSDVIAAGVLPAALEMMDAPITRAVEDFVGAGYPRDAQAVLLAEVDGLDCGVETHVEAIAAVARANGATLVRVAADDTERALLWKGRKAAFGAIARIAPDYYLHDAVVPRTQLVSVLRRVYEIAEAHEILVMNVFHAGDGNLHPLLVFDGREAGVWERVYAAGKEILNACLDAGGVLTGEHGVGIEKRDLMSRMFTRDDLDAQARLPRRVRPGRRGEPGEGAAAWQPVRRDATRTRGRLDMTDEEPRAPARAVAPVGARTQWEVGGPPPLGALEVRAPAGVITYEPADMTITVGAGTSFAIVDEVLAEHGQECPLDPRRHSATVGGILACGLSGIRRLRHGPVRDHVLEVRFETGDGRLVKGGGPTVKNVTGYDLPRLFVGSFGTIGVLQQATLRCRPRPRAAAWFSGADASGRYRPSARLWSGGDEAVLLEGVHGDVEEQGRGLAPLGVAPELPDGDHRGRISVAPGNLRACASVLAADVRWCAELGVGTIHIAADDADALIGARAVAHAYDGWMLREAGGPPTDDGYGIPLPNLALMRRVKHTFDPHGRLNPGRLPLGAEVRAVTGSLQLDPDGLNACVSCGLCLPHCPTYRVTGREIASPRGRIAAMRAVETGAAPVDDAFRDAMEQCVSCRGCEAACPSGVRFGLLMETTRAALAPARSRKRRVAEWLGYTVVVPRHWLLLACTWVAWTANGST